MSGTAAPLTSDRESPTNRQISPWGRTHPVNTLETQADFIEATARLARRPPEILAAFIVSLAHRTGPVHERVLSFLAADDPAMLSACLRTQILRLRNGRDRRPRDEGSGANAVRLEYVLDAIEQAVLPSDPKEALALLTLALECDATLLDQSTDFAHEISCAILRACSLIELVAALLPIESTRATLEQLYASDTHGCRGPLAAIIAGLEGSRSP